MRNLYKILLYASITLKINISYANINDLNDVEINTIKDEQEREYRQFEQEIDNLYNYYQQPEYQKQGIEENQSTACVDIKKIRIHGSQDIKQKEILQKARSYENNCLTINKINELIENLNQIFFDAGYITTRASLPMPQNEIAQGTLNIQVTEGYISAFKYKSNQPEKETNTDSQIRSAFPSKAGEILNLRDIEQGIEQLNLLSGRDATMKFIPGNEVGETVIIIENTLSNKGNIYLTYDNSGEDNTGNDNLTLGLTRENLLSLNDSITISHKRDQKYSDEDYSYSDSINYSQPFGYYNFNYYGYRSNYKTTSTTSLNNKIITTGTSKGHFFTLSRTLSRGKIYKSSLSVDFSLKSTNADNYSLNTDISTDVTDRKLTVMKITLGNNLYTKFGTFIIKPSYNFGLDNFGALDDKDSILDEEAQYEAAKLYIYYGNYFNLPYTDTPIGYNMSFNSQYSKDHLYSSERFSIGGEYSIRGFNDAYLQGESGYSIRNNFTFNLPNQLSFISPTIFFDYGMAYDLDYKNRQYLSGNGIKLEYNNKNLSANTTFAQSLNTPEEIEPEKSIYLNLTFMVNML